jgi:putative ubiquitin-RnfH superfamily antitoxin RatB of RatAB toxin-antitoxin module
MPKVEVVYATSRRQARYALELGEGATVRDAIERSGVLAAFPEIDLGRDRVGVHGQLVTLATRLGEDDRIEILRPLQADPREARRRRARQGR